MPAGDCERALGAIIMTCAAGNGSPA